MFLSRFFRKRPAEAAGAALYASAAKQARQPAFYLAMGAPDTLEGRFELYTLHVILLIDRLSGQGEQAAETSQAAFDAYVRGLDDALREIGVGDLSMKKKMKKLAGAFYGRLQAWQEASATLPDTAALQAVLARTTFEAAEGGDPAALAAYVAAARTALAAQPLDVLLSGEVAWPKP
jgi:cytochrome b pre-mRNA-processing protein 3